MNKWYGKSGQLPLVTKNFRVDIASARIVSMCVSACASVPVPVSLQCAYYIRYCEFDLCNFFYDSNENWIKSNESSRFSMKKYCGVCDANSSFFYLCASKKTNPNGISFYSIHRWWLEIENKKRKYNMTCVHERLTKWMNGWMKLSKWMNSLTSHLTLRLRLCSSEKILRKICAKLKVNVFHKKKKKVVASNLFCENLHGNNFIQIEFDIFFRSESIHVVAYQ